MKQLSRSIIAADAASRIAEANCRDAGPTWNTLEAQHEEAHFPKESADIVADARENFCTGCPAFQACDQWAKAEKYTGLAAGAAFLRGERKPDTWVSRRTGRPKLKQAS
jgi:hypothetical protein